MIRRGDQNHVHVLAVEHAAKIFHRVRGFAALILANGHALGELGVVHVADHAALNFRIQEKAFQVHLALTAAADEAETDFVIRARFARADTADEWRTKSPRRQCGERALADEFSPIDHLHIKKTPAASD